MKPFQYLHLFSRIRRKLGLPPTFAKFVLISVLLPGFLSNNAEEKANRSNEGKSNSVRFAKAAGELLKFSSKDGIVLRKSEGGFVRLKLQELSEDEIRSILSVPMVYEALTANEGGVLFEGGAPASNLRLADGLALELRLQSLWLEQKTLATQVTERLEIFENMKRYNASLVGWMGGLTTWGNAFLREDAAYDKVNNAALAALDAEIAAEDARSIRGESRIARKYYPQLREAQKNAERSLALSQAQAAAAARQRQTAVEQTAANQQQFRAALAFLNSKGFKLNTEPPWHVLPPIDGRLEVDAAIRRLPPSERVFATASTGRAVAGSTPTSESFDPGRGLVSFFSFTGTPNNSVGSKHAFAHKATLTTDRFAAPDRAYHFNGIDSSIALPHVFESESYTVSFWFNPAALPNLSNSRREASMLLSSGRNNCEIHLGTPPFSNNGIRFLPRLINSTRGQYWDARSTVIPLNQWSHLVAVYDRGSNRAALYLNGKELDLIYDSGGDSEDNRQLPARLGVRYDVQGPNTGLPFQGKIDSLRVYNRALNQIEAGELFKLKD